MPLGATRFGFQGGLAPLDVSYLDPTGILLSNGDYLIVSAVAPNELGDRDYVLYKKILKLP